MQCELIFMYSCLKPQLNRNNIYVVHINNEIHLQNKWVTISAEIVTYYEKNLEDAWDQLLSSIPCLIADGVTLASEVVSAKMRREEPLEDGTYRGVLLI